MHALALRSEVWEPCGFHVVFVFSTALEDLFAFSEMFQFYITLLFSPHDNFYNF